VTDPASADDVSIDWAALGYDQERQIAVTQQAGTAIPAFKHTNNQTSTSTSASDRNGPDRDTDVGGD
jgi:putative ATP-grasp target RiPP